jgi:hypothetical protein
LFNGENEMSPKDIRQKCIKYNPILRKWLYTWYLMLMKRNEK